MSGYTGNVQGLLLINLGTPDEPTVPAVRRYLREFLWDRRVIDINPVSRFLLLNLFILPTRPAKSAAAYRQIWTDRGSPLLLHSQDLQRAVAARLGSDWHVELAMRYGRPSIRAGLVALVAQAVERLVVLPLYPQHALSSTVSSLDKVEREAASLAIEAERVVVPAFYANPGFIESHLVQARRARDDFSPDHVLFTFHGLPQRQVRATDPTGAHCLHSATCCDAPVEANRHCYRFHAFETARQIAAGLGLEADRYGLSFQSRLGRTPWLRPYTDHVVPELAGKGVKRLMLISASFVADCLETLEELGIRARAQFLESGGEAFHLVPSLNATPRWVETVTDLALAAASGDG